ncbi:hypothetical protein HYDPIDRAFT_113309 [Hydnomerulius pinastri MD-312]|uniref:Unplaced genomic scaffold scaffold_17, whole genome shotgun sequence n=1 Tax=Hydnomerulius pinastri MD-312 TaxID=994086 RepID=A0A0C9W7R9_9AGAM|nr:hypothetical protein HYDPIDRAFT_113309 [Hydnomerulius pinastri MD-312]
MYHYDSLTGDELIRCTLQPWLVVHPTITYHRRNKVQVIEVSNRDGISQSCIHRDTVTLTSST